VGDFNALGFSRRTRSVMRGMQREKRSAAMLKFVAGFSFDQWPVSIEAHQLGIGNREIAKSLACVKMIWCGGIFKNKASRG